ncbi:hypothetical protein RGU70_13725 [Herbaspirillum sp. RTI4]|uniref:hypothetical protein n=1 Tax=Herbaspirillum sp. RTI4 TaxID=3048640 RepID=UPI002AB56E3C|nr:hypothetical protein [Herbaspirillum sp. RTI4]MDY7579373.1 hypothetical protein [Herbaspirillum sp. RTI4]MEA9980287.1 hypothetical protein [Herbaspirillum sp. RTI4]
MEDHQITAASYKPFQLQTYKAGIKDVILEVPRFINPGEDIKKAIKRRMNLCKPKALSRKFPKSFSSTADYFRQYKAINSAACLEFTNLSFSGFAMNEGPEVVYSEVDE